jgi:hypothetical protein
MNSVLLFVLFTVLSDQLSSQETGRLVHRRTSKKNLPPPFVGPDFEDGKSDYADYLDNSGQVGSLDDNIEKKDADILTIEDMNGANVPKMKLSSKGASLIPSNDGIKYGKTRIIPRSKVTRNGQDFMRYDIIVPMEVALKQKAIKL